MDVPTWAQDLKQMGLYYEGYVEDIDLVRQKHKPKSIIMHISSSS